MSDKDAFMTRLGFVTAAMGQAIGTGNIWRFPRVATANGGGPFMVAYVIAVFVWAVPLLMAEMSLGMHTRKGSVGAFRDFMGKKYTWMGGWHAFVCLALGAYYSVTMGWAIKYFVLSITTLRPGVDTELVWNSFISSPWQGIFYHAISVAIAAVVVFRGVNKGIELASKLMIPTLFVLLIIAMIRALTLPGAAGGLNYLFNPNFSKLLNGRVWLEAFTQAAWSTGAGWGFMTTYAAYSREKEDIACNAFIVGLSDTSAALLAGMTVIPTIYALAPENLYEAIGAGNTGLTFIWLARLLPTMPAGTLVSALFFLAMTFAAVTSLYAMYEVGIKSYFIDAGWSRRKAASVVVALCFLGGLPSAINVEFLNNQDQVWGVGLLVSGLFVAIAMMKYGVEKVRKEIINPVSELYVGKWWNWCILCFPAMFTIVCGWWTYQQFTWYPATWWNPFETYSPGTMFLQWALVIVIFMLFNNTLAKAIINNDEVVKVEVMGEPIKGGARS
ncbi:MAG TPA: sodium-dependent transporter [Acetomicrobium flavidum]|uniref:sodium-dependent transporter n=1 Tax=Acetomicrobium flavidum TaxID=49896 RepID=UPI002C0B0464|nr:sodium-dependent transporter [Acetomicrobium flavidum]